MDAELREEKRREFVASVEATAKIVIDAGMAMIDADRPPVFLALGLNVRENGATGLYISSWIENDAVVEELLTNSLVHHALGRRGAHTVERIEVEAGEQWEFSLDGGESWQVGMPAESVRDAAIVRIGGTTFGVRG